MPASVDSMGVGHQYAAADNLSSRIELHRRFSVNAQGWSNWVFSQYHLKHDAHVLELGCGNAAIWAEHASELPEGMRLVLSDLSPGMLDAARRSTRSLPLAEYRVIDAQDIPYGDNTFDAVFANHMLYHVPDVQRALAAIARTLKPEGVLYATTTGRDNLKEIGEILIGYDAGIHFPQNDMCDIFGLESGAVRLRECFNDVRLLRYEDSLHITEPDPLIRYILSLDGMGNVTRVISGDRVADFISYIHALMEKRGFIDVTKDAGMLIARNR